MTPEEIDNALTELSNRMERVRALYEQYFMGIERLEPTIPRKDLDRRMETLRKTSFQNTAKRFKFQTLVQRYTSLQQYWYRTCRDIENGTYRKHIRKAQRKFEAQGQPTDETLTTSESPPPRGLSAKEAAEEDMKALLEGDVDLAAEFNQLVGTLREQHGSAKTSLGSLGKRSADSSSEGGSRSKTSPTLTLNPRATPSQHLPLLTSTAPRPLTKLNSPGPSLIVGEPSPRPAPLPSAARLHPAAPANPAVPTNPPAPTNPAVPSKATPATAATTPSVGAAQPAAPLPRASAQRPAPLPSLTKTAPLGNSTAARPTPSLPTGLTEERIRAIHAQYVSARAQTHASAVSFEKLEQNIRQTEAQLRAQHQGKHVDFDVTIKDGKAILKPRLK